LIVSVLTKASRKSPNRCKGGHISLAANSKETSESTPSSVEGGSVDSEQAGNLSNWFGILLDEFTSRGDFFGGGGRLGIKTHPSSFGGGATGTGALHNE
jgi:hypothetical protein